LRVSGLSLCDGYNISRGCSCTKCLFVSRWAGARYCRRGVRRVRVWCFRFFFFPFGRKDGGGKGCVGSKFKSRSKLGVVTKGGELERRECVRCYLVRLLREEASWRIFISMRHASRNVDPHSKDNGLCSSLVSCHGGGKVVEEIQREGIWLRYSIVKVVSPFIDYCIFPIYSSRLHLTPLCLGKLYPVCRNRVRGARLPTVARHVVGGFIADDGMCVVLAS
jgi:hypothetical protein